MFEKNDRTTKYDRFTHQTIIPEIFRAFCLGWRILRKSLGYAEDANIISGISSHEYNTDLLQSLSSGLHNL